MKGSELDIIASEMEGGCSGDHLDDVWLGIPAKACVGVLEDLVASIVGCERLLSIPIWPAVDNANQYQMGW